MSTVENPPIPTTQRYQEALTRLSASLSPNQLALLQAHHQTPDHTATAAELAQAVGFKDYRGVNAEYGRLGKLLREALDFKGEGQESFVIAAFVAPGTQGNTEWLWVMHPELADALEQLGWTSGSQLKTAPTAKHLVSYHNADKMGYSFEDSDPFAVVTKKPVGQLIGSEVWSIAGVGQPRRYFLGSWFIIDEVGSAKDHEGFDNYVSGRVGHVFDPMIPLNDLPWFLDFLKSQHHFSLGLQTVKEEYARQLAALAANNGSSVSRVRVFPEEVPFAGVYREGSVSKVTVNAYERNAAARQRCIQHYGTDCCVCGFSFGRTYGMVVEGLIHVHHLRPLSEIGADYTVDPVADLRPVCPNCHAVLHSRTPAFSIEEVKTLLARNQ